MCATRLPGETPKPPLVPIPIGGPFNRIGVDIIRSKRRNRYAVIFVDYLTKWVEAFTIRDQSALTIAKLLVGEVITRHGVPNELLSDRGVALLSNQLQEVYCLMGIHKVLTLHITPIQTGSSNFLIKL